MKWDGDKSPFVRVSPGIYALKSFETKQAATQIAEEIPALKEAGLINAFGMYWSRSAVIWKAKLRLLGQQQQDSTAVDFTTQTGVYLLYDGRQVIYVGRAIEQSLGARL